MNQQIERNADITVMYDTVPIRFAHLKTLDKPENHVLHINNYVEIYVYISGDHRYIVENSLYDLHCGDIIVINPLEVHKALPLKETPYERFYFLVDLKTFESMHLDPLAPILNKPSGVGNLISFDAETRQSILQMLYAISDCFRDGHNDQLRAFSFFLRFLDEINHYLTQTPPSSGNITHTPKLLKQILTYVADNTATLQSTTEIASSLGITPQYLSTYFSSHIGTPLKHYIQTKKIALAKDLLDKGADVTQACYDCGFNDCSYFIRIFKKYVGLTPTEYRQNALW